MHPEIESKLRLCPCLPTLSGVALRIVALARDPDINLDEIIALVSNDPALAAKMLRVANSSLYGRAREVHNLRQAVTVLGLNTTMTLTLSFSLAVSLRETELRINLDRFWRRALLSALAARTLGACLGLHSLEELFLAALLQDIGMLALDVALPERYRPEALGDADHEHLIARERYVLATDHCEAGAWLMREWRLPEYLSLAIQGSHNLGAPDVPADLSPFIGCVAVSGRIAEIYLAAEPSAATATARRTAEDCLGLSADALSEVLDRMVESLPEIEALFEVPVLSAAQAAGLTHQARELLASRNLKLLESAAHERNREVELQQLAARLYDIARRDALTGVFNRRHFDEALDDAFAQAGGQRQPLSLAYLDLDHFKTINDRYGHLIGDTVLYTVARHIQARLRQNDLLARYGGEEFVVLMPGIDRAAAYTIVGRIRSAVEALEHPLETGDTVQVTLSVGVATFGEGGQRMETPSELVHAADRALYQAKRQGRNRVVQADRK
jgi:diguanylate cyclase (GGDEF)-like protein